MRKQCVPGAPPFFVCAGDEATCQMDHVLPYLSYKMGCTCGLPTLLGLTRALCNPHFVVFVISQQNG